MQVKLYTLSLESAVEFLDTGAWGDSPYTAEMPISRLRGGLREAATVAAARLIVTCDNLRGALWIE